MFFGGGGGSCGFFIGEASMEVATAEAASFSSFLRCWGFARDSDSDCDFVDWREVVASLAVAFVIAALFIGANSNSYGFVYHRQ